MKSLICGASMLALLLVAGVVSQTAGAADDEHPTIEKIMESLHKGRTSPIATLKGALKSSSPDWSTIQKQSATYAKLAGEMPANDPPKGDAASFKKLARAYAANAKDLDSAAKKEDLAATKTAFGKIGSSCMACHKAHRPN
jgi:cytochrome c556